MVIEMTGLPKDESMTEEISRDLYKIEIPLPKSPLQALNSYVVKGPERNLVIDTGWNQQQCLDAMHAGLRELGVEIEKTDFFITHIHADHLGLVSSLKTDDSKVYFNQPDADRFKNPWRWDDFLKFAVLNGYPEAELQKTIEGHPALKFRAKEIPPFQIVNDGDRISIGDYGFTCVQTPGHTWGHMCLYESQKKILVSGDLILNDITPNIQLWSDEWDPLKQYLTSLERVNRLDIELVLPGHRSLFKDSRKRIRELKHHHQIRLDEIVSILRKGKKTAFEVASQMSWDIVCDSWDLFPLSQKWFATGEAIAHLKYLKEEGIIRREMLDHTILFSI